MDRVHVPAGMRRYPRARPPWGPKNTLIVLATYSPWIALALASFFLDSSDTDDTEEWVLVALFGFTLVVQQAGATAVALWALRASWSNKVEGLGLSRYEWTGLWRPALMTIALYGGIIIYTVVMDALGVVEPESNVSEDFVRSPILIVMSFVMICVGAPLAEEIVFRGGIFGGLLAWGFWPAALLSGLLFSAVHGDLGSLAPFTMIGVGLAWLYWSRGSLWDSIICHAMFNFTSYLLLISGEA
jgi:membrane protease YdiL (CAAX protease family)